MADAIHFVEANGLNFAYLEDGSGPLVLMLHGFPDTAHTWADLREQAQSRTAVFVLKNLDRRYRLLKGDLFAQYRSVWLEETFRSNQ